MFKSEISVLLGCFSSASQENPETGQIVNKDGVFTQFWKCSVSQVLSLVLWTVGRVQKPSSLLVLKSVEGPSTPLLYPV